MLSLQRVRQSDLMTAARLFLVHCLIWLLTLASPAGAGHVVVADLHKGIAQSIFAGLQEGAPERLPGQSDDDYAAVYNAWKNDVAGQANLLGAVVGYTTSGGQAVNVSNAASIAESGARNNYLNHTQRARVEKLIDELNSCRVTRDCSLAEHDAMITELRQLQEVSSQQTIAMLAACENGPSPACAAHVAAAAEFEEWAWHSGYNDMGRIVGFTPSMFQARTAGAGYDLDNDVNLDLIALELARGIQSGALDPDVAAEQLLASLQRQDGGMKVLGGVGQTLSAGACFVTKLTCVLGLANAAVGVDRTYEGTVTLISGENQLSAIEAGLVATGYSATEAEALRDDIEAGVAIVTVGVGGAYFVYRGGIAVAQLGKVDGLQGAGAPNTALPNVPGRVQSRVNLSTGDKSSGWTHVLDRHFNPDKNASQFTVSQSELRTTLQSHEVVNTPVTRTLESADHGTLYVREVDLGRPIGTDKFNSFQPTSTMTVMTDRFGNLVTATPGVVP